MPFTKPVVTYLLPFTRIGGNITFPPPLVSLLQTDGSFMRQKGRVAMILTSQDTKTTYRDMYEIKGALNSTEMEWASVAKGLEFALEKNQEALAIENDNLGVVSALLLNTNLKHEYAKYYKHEIIRLARQTVWTGIRWIPREKNVADTLFLK